ncbi:hypothetical protein AVEN_96566-1 [Araneus ventricosus]|uniref:DUF659 domain-containing protein n=1 Tax=Araneus ventricosus TaxID=182803 RepID=A0A4Y2H910_ARAVE|nr:hypothetical protein AVEN_96566-1 [Araneus ventricosus]
MGKKTSLQFQSCHLEPENAAEAIYKILEQWDLVNQVIAMTFDTTSVNTVHLNGTCTLLEDKNGRDLLWLACCHHNLELILAKVFTLCFVPSSSPEIPLFKRKSGTEK